MKRRAWIAGWVGVALGALVMVSGFLAAIWVGDDRFTQTAVLALFLTIPGMVSMGVWSDDPPPRNLPRADRRRLREEKRRIDLEAAIERLEREAGLR